MSVIRYAMLAALPMVTGCGQTAGTAAQSQQTVAAEQPAPSDAVVDTTFDDIKFDMEPIEQFNRQMLTPQIEELIGRRIRIRGYIYPTLKKDGLKQFVLVRDNLECCFGPGAALYDCILVDMTPGKTAKFSIRPVAVEGRFRFSEIIGPDGNHLAIYGLEGESVK